MTRDDFITAVAEAIKTINTTIEDEDLLSYVASEVVDRVYIYLNYGENEKISERLVKIVARIGSGIFNQTLANSTSTTADSAISSLSDNGQAISYSNEVKNYLSTTDDNELFSGFAKLLAPYRRIDVVS